MKKEMKGLTEIYGENVFSLKIMKKYLSEKTYKSLRATIKEGCALDRSIADEVAEVMKDWAVEKGATHFTHWFQPLTGATAEKHDSFIVPDDRGGAVLQFSGAELIKGEPDASSFPSGGLRATFEARGYTAWDPTSPAFVKESKTGATLCIPTAFYSYHGDALDKKTPLLRSMDALSKQVKRLGKLFGIDNESNPSYVTIGPEQEYFLIDKKYYDSRIDLLQTGRTLFGRVPAKHQQLEDHYFGSIKERVLDFMTELDNELWKLGIPSKTRHNEVCPAQFEIAPMYERLNLGVDHNMLVMDTLQRIAIRHGFVCLLHEKPYAGVNGSGKHNNWSIVGPDGKNWLSPGDDPHDNAKFLTMICALMQAVDKGAGLLRASVASAGNDHRLGANEAPPAIISVFLGEQLTDVIEQIEAGGAKSSKKGGFIKIGVSSLPPLPRDATDRNRTSPFAFTGNKFEFRAVGSNQSCAGANIILNTIVADALDDICRELEDGLKKKKDFNNILQEILQDIVKKHKRILFNGDNYTEAWDEEAKRRGLLNLRTTPEALKVMETKETTALFKKHKVLSETELKSRNEIYKEQYKKTLNIEALCALEMVRTLIIPTVMEYQDELAGTLDKIKKISSETGELEKLLKEICASTEKALRYARRLEESIQGGSSPDIIVSINKLREVVDTLEGIIPGKKWPLASYAEMMFKI